MNYMLDKVNEYLAKESDYAIQITGNWGYGKTHYYRTVLEPSICDKQTYANAAKKYKAVYVSLFGLKTIDDIATKIVIDFYQSALFKGYFKSSRNNKKLKITQNVLKIALRGFIGFNKLGNVNEYLTDIREISSKVLDTSELVVCFDDMERKDSCLSMEDLTGYINSLVDEKIKVLIISNDDLLKSEKDYKNLTEKIIGIKVEYAPEVERVISDIIASRYRGFDIFRDHLSENKALLNSFALAVNKNFRHVTYALDNLHHCYSLIKREILDSKHEIYKKVEEQMPNITLFVLAISAEYKSSNLKHTDAGDYQNINLSFEEIFDSTTPEKSENIADKKYENLIKKYKIAKGNYHFYESLFQYITGIQEFDIVAFINEFTNEFHLQKGQVLPAYEVLNALSYTHLLKLSDTDYEQKTLKVFEFAKSGVYKAVEYLSIMHYAERFDNLLQLNLTDVLKDLINGLAKAIANPDINTDSDFTQFDFSGQHGETSENIRQLYLKGMELITPERQKREREKINEVVSFFMDNTDEFLRKFTSDSDTDFRFRTSEYPFLNYIDTLVLCNKFVNASTETLSNYYLFFETRYKNRQLLSTELSILQQLNSLLASDKKIKANNPKSLRVYYLIRLIKLLYELGKNNTSSSDA